ncbi:MAG: division/cell wall cluster transcriptional repressor MraZ [Bdellovibrionaceae bacterium]|nr:division/cell wall cluster transcriptional repressor MraZ [Bdellovibrionales bacterium]MCB9084792.1 division/cell wall cluster transcriptional repressor MraZ [Pseudobdellovibrionaceae bacterium]
MTALFRGRFDCKIDPKGRFKLPANYKQSLPKKETSLVITNGQYQGQRCLDVYTLKEWENLEKRISRLSPLKAEVQAYQRFYMAGAQVVNGDAQDRLLIPQGLRKFAALEEEAVLVGMGGKFEIWSAQRWQELYESLAGDFDNILAVVADMDKGDE